MKKLTAETINGSSSCPQCGNGDKLNMQALVDSDLRSYATWLVCEHCGWDQRVVEPQTPVPDHQLDDASHDAGHSPQP